MPLEVEYRVEGAELSDFYSVANDQTTGLQPCEISTKILECGCKQSKHGNMISAAYDDCVAHLVELNLHVFHNPEPIINRSFSTNWYH
jgi:hypothetical protein